MRRTAAVLAAGGGGNDWLTDAHIWFDMNQSSITDTVRPGWTKAGSANWVFAQGWNFYKRLFITLDDANIPYGNSWTLNFRQANGQAGNTSYSGVRAILHRGVQNFDGYFHVSWSCNNGTAQGEFDVKAISNGTTYQNTLSVGYQMGNGTLYNITIVSDGDADELRLYIDGAHRHTLNGAIDIQALNQSGYLGINAAYIPEGSFCANNSGLHFSWLNYAASTSDISSIIDPAMDLMQPGA